MKSTGEVMGLGDGFGMAFFKAQMGAGSRLPATGRVFISVNDRDKQAVVEVARQLHDAGLTLMATQGTGTFLAQHGIEAEIVRKVHEGRPHVEDAIRSHMVDLVINSPQDEHSQYDDYIVRRAAIVNNIPYTTTLAGAQAAAAGIQALSQTEISVRALQDYHRDA